MRNIGSALFGFAAGMAVMLAVLMLAPDGVLAPLGAMRERLQGRSP